MENGPIGFRNAILFTSELPKSLMTHVNPFRTPNTGNVSNIYYNISVIAIDNAYLLVSCN